MAALPSVDGNTHSDQTQAAPRNQTGARKATCSEDKLLTIPKTQAMTFFLPTERPVGMILTPTHDKEKWG